MNPYESLQITPNPDGSLTRNPPFPDIPPTGYSNNDSDSTQTAATIDIPLNTTNNTYVRVYHPVNVPPNDTEKLPIIVYFHGGGFILFSAACWPWHEFCLSMATNVPAIILSVNYRLAPENRLPAAYDDAVDAILWLKKQALNGEHKFTNFVDFTNCFLMGNSSGGNIVYHAALRALDLDLGPVKIKGLILNVPFFGGVERSESELKYANDRILPLPVADLMWQLSIPVGSDRDNDYSNPMIQGPNRMEIKSLPRCYVNGYGEDPLIDRQKEFVKMLQGHGVSVVSHFLDGGYHAVELFEQDKAQILLMDLKNFIPSSNGVDYKST